MSSYVFQFFCGPEGIALASPRANTARPALAPPPRTNHGGSPVELVLEEPLRRPASKHHRRHRSPSRPTGLVNVIGVITITATIADDDRHQFIDVGVTAVRLTDRCTQGQQRRKQRRGGQQRLLQVRELAKAKPLRSATGSSTASTYAHSTWHVSHSACSVSAKTSRHRPPITHGECHIRSREDHHLLSRSLLRGAMKDRGPLQRERQQASQAAGAQTATACADPSNCACGQRPAAS